MMKDPGWKWLFDSNFDKERKGLEWRSYLKQVDADFRLMMLSPKYAEVKKSRNEFELLLDNWQNLYNQVPENISGVDPVNKQWLFAKNQGHDAVEERLGFLRECIMPQLRMRYSDGICIKEFIYDHLHLSPIGIESLYIKSGFMLLKNSHASNTVAFHYNFNGLIDEENRHFMTTEKVWEYEYSLSNSFYSMKKHLQDTFSNQEPVYLVESDIELPLWHSIRPVAKSKLARYIGSV